MIPEGEPGRLTDIERFLFDVSGYLVIRGALSPTEVAALPHLQARNAFPEIPHPTRGKVRVTSTPFQVDGQPTGPLLRLHPTEVISWGMEFAEE